MSSDPVVEFTMKLADFRKATKHLSLNREEFKESDCADLLISSFAATFRSVGTTTEVPVEGRHAGTVRLPLRLLPKIIEVAKTYRKPDVKWHFEPGTMQIEKFKWKHPDITLGTIPDPKLDMPTDAGPLQTLAMASLLSPEDVADQGWRERVEIAQKQASTAISSASSRLEQFGISREQIQALVEASIHRTEESLGGHSRTGQNST